MPATKAVTECAAEARQEDGDKAAEKVSGFVGSEDGWVNDCLFRRRPQRLQLQRNNSARDVEIINAYNKDI